MWVRKRLDIGYPDLGFAMLAPLVKWASSTIAQRVERHWSPDGDALACLSVRSGFDLLLTAVHLPVGSEVLFSAITIPDMARIAEEHGLIPIPVDLDAADLSVSGETLEEACSPRTRAIVVAHLFGGRMPMEPIVDFARRHGLLVIEDCAQAYDGGQYRGDGQADASMFSFGPIKTATALGGGLLRVRDRSILRRMRDSQTDYRRQGRWHFFRRTAKYALLKLLSSRPVFTVFIALCGKLSLDFDRWINGSAHGFAGGHFFSKIRRRPSAPLLALLERRLARFDPARASRQVERGDLLAGLLQPAVGCPGADRAPHTHWVFPILSDRPAELVTVLRRSGFDATQGASLTVIPPPPNRPQLAARTSSNVLSQIVFLPLYPEMPLSAVQTMAATVLLVSRTPVATDRPARECARS